MIEQFSVFFANLGVPPIVAGLAIGAVFGFFLRGILSPKPAAAVKPAAPAPTVFSQPRADYSGSGRETLRHLNLLASVEADIHDALSRGSKIEAIKILREATGLGLKESKDLIDHLDGSVERRDDARY